MQKCFAAFFLMIFFGACKSGKHVPDVSEIKLSFTTQRFEKELFAIDTNRLAPQLDRLIAKYPGFGENFLSTILGLDPAWPADTTAYYVKGFLSYNKTVYDTAEKIFADFSRYEGEIKKASQFVKYYFPKYNLPTKIITYLGPVDGYGDILDDDIFIIGLHAHLGKDFPLYKTALIQEVYPEYISNRFEPSYIAINCMKNITDDMYPDRSSDKSLLIQMVEKGKKLFLLSQFLPETKEFMLIGYTDKQLKDAYAHERVIWDLFVQNNLLRGTDNNLTKNYVMEGPKTQELGEGAPGNIGSFAGWQIVKKYMTKFPETTPAQLMNTDAEKIFSEAKYKP